VNYDSGKIQAMDSDSFRDFYCDNLGRFWDKAAEGIQIPHADAKNQREKPDTAKGGEGENAISQNAVKKNAQSHSETGGQTGQINGTSEVNR